MKKIINKVLLPTVAMFFILTISTVAKNYSNMAQAQVVSPQALTQNNADKLNKIKDKIKEKKVKWEAGETSVSKLSPEEKKKRVIPKNKLKAALQGINQTEESVASATAAALPATLDFRNYNGGNYVTPVKDQGSCGSCWDFGTTATAESANLLKSRTPYSQNPLDLSEQVMISCSGSGNCEEGGYIDKASTYLQNTGLPVESCYPYEAANGACTNACDNWQNSTYKISDSVRIFTDVDAVATIKNALAIYGPLVVAFEVYTDFFYYQGGVYSYAYGTLEGSHIVTVIGYDDALQAFIAKNSWGTWWGENGFFKIAYSETDSMLAAFGEVLIAYNTQTPLGLACTPADANSDGSINISDVQTCINVILGTDTIESHRTCSDVNGGGVNITDCQGIINKILNP